MFTESAIHTSETGWIEVVCGSMFSGKTEELMRRMKRAQIARLDIEIFKPQTDTRYSEEEVVSHDQNSIQATVVSSSQEILLYASNAQVIGIDEAQFFDNGIVDVVNTLANQGKRIVIAGLDMDFQGKPFGPMPYLLAVAEYVTKVHAICVKTGGLAHYSHRISDGENTILLGEKEHYEPVSRTVFKNLTKTV